MKPILDFDPDVFILSGPGVGDPIGEHVDEVAVLPLFFDYLGAAPVLVSVWRVGLRDILRMIFSRKLYVMILGQAWPPISIVTEREMTGLDEHAAMRAAGGGDDEGTVD